MSVEVFQNHKKNINLRKKLEKVEKGVSVRREEEISPWGKGKNAEI